MLTFILILIIVAALLLIGVVLIQNPKGGIAANFVAPSQIMGVKKGTEVIEKATWVFAIVLIVLSLASNFFRPASGTVTENTNDSRIKESIENVNVPAQQQQPGGAAGQQQQQQQNP